VDEQLVGHWQMHNRIHLYLTRYRRRRWAQVRSRAATQVSSSPTYIMARLMWLAASALELPWRAYQENSRKVTLLSPAVLKDALARLRRKLLLRPY